MVDAYTRVFITDPGSWPEDEDMTRGQGDSSANLEIARKLAADRAIESLLIEGIDFCLGKYKGAYGTLPNSVLASDSTIDKLRASWRVSYWTRKPRGAYSGRALRTGSHLIRIYREEVVGELLSRMHEFPHYPLTFATQGFWDSAREFFRVGRDEAERFYNLLWCDVGVSRSQLEKEIERQLKK